MDKGKLRSLMFHAGFCDEDGGWDNRPIWEQEKDNFQRFAEMIVSECVDICEDNWGLIEPTKEQIVNQIKKHFGVEE